MRALVALCVALVACLFGARAEATSCVQPTPDNGDKYSDVVFEAQAEGDGPDANGVMGAKLRVFKVYKGTVPASVVIRYGGMKGFTRFEKGKRYLVWGRISDGTLFAHLCSPTHVLPAPKRFTEGVWKGWSPEGFYGPARKPGGTLAGGKPKQPVPPKPQPAPEPASTEPAPTPTPIGTVQATPIPSPAPQESGGCAGCAIVGSRSSPGTWLFALMALVVLRRRRVT